jgi:hypothetical protein
MATPAYTGELNCPAAAETVELTLQEAEALPVCEQLCVPALAVIDKNVLADADPVSIATNRQKNPTRILHCWMLPGAMRDRN